MSNSKRPTTGRNTRRLLGLSLVLFLAAAASLAGLDTRGPGLQAKPSKANGARPNILVIESDDQSQEAQRVMDVVNRRIGGQGATFRDSFVSDPLCCPSRAAFLTGQYARNNGVRTNSPPDGGYSALDNSNTLPVWLQDSGYYTSLIGKYLNGYERTPQPQTIPAGWTNWQGTTVTYKYYDYQLNENGQLVDYGEDPADYQTDVFTQKAVDLIQQQQGTRKPWFTWLTYLAPHGGGPEPSPNPPANCGDTAKPAPRDAGAFDDEPLPIGPSFNESDVSDKPSFIADQSLFSSGTINEIQRRYRCRLGSLLALDDGVDRIIDTLRQTGQLDNTYIIYTSDNGWFDGQHRITSGKRRLYEPSIRVPLMIRGPGIKPGTEVKDLAINTDLAPTIASLAKAGDDVRRKFDGRSLRPFWLKPSRQRGRQLLLDGTRKRGSAIRNRRYYFAHFVTGEYEMYDLANDPDELQNVYGDPNYADAQAALTADLDALKRCAGARCTRSTGAKLVIQRRGNRPRQCARPPRAARLIVPGGGIDRVAFKVDSAATVLDTEPPFGVEISPGQASRAQLTVDARVELLDGRRVTLSKTATICH
ncbi:sulfatase [soil metagenome]